MPVACAAPLAGPKGRSGGPHAAWTRARRQPAAQAALRQCIEQRIARIDPDLHVGVVVLSAEDGRQVFALRGEERFVPASTVKMLTAATALQVLGPSYRFATELYADGFAHEQHKVRNLYLKGAGDPSLDLGHLSELVAILKQAGITKVEGEVVLDDTAYDRLFWGRGWMWDDLGDGFSAPVSALNVAGNALSLWVVPGPKVGAPARGYLQPTTRFVKLSSGATTAAGSGGTVRIAFGDDAALVGPPPTPPVGSAAFGAANAAFGAADLALMPGHHLSISGSLGLDASPRLRRFAVRDPAAWVATLLREQLEAQGIAVPANWRVGPTPTGASTERLATHWSEPLGALLPGYLKASDNHAMECLLKRVALQVSGEPASFAAGAAAVRSYLEAEAKLDTHNLVLLDGSGASRYDLATPQALAQLALHASSQFATGAEFTASLPIGGTDGTLRHRMRDAALRGRVRAKTGTMTGVSALSGLLLAAGDEPLVFAIMVDNATASADALRALQDDILRLLVPAPSSKGAAAGN